jgi:hypothetical protein
VPLKKECHCYVCASPIDSLHHFPDFAHRNTFFGSPLQSPGTSPSPKPLVLNVSLTVIYRYGYTSRAHSPLHPPLPQAVKLHPWIFHVICLHRQITLQYFASFVLVVFGFGNCSKHGLRLKALVFLASSWPRSTRVT